MFNEFWFLFRERFIEEKLETQNKKFVIEKNVDDVEKKEENKNKNSNLYSKFFQAEKELYKIPKHLDVDVINSEQFQEKTTWSAGLAEIPVSIE